MNQEIRNIGKEWLECLPEHWKIERIKDVCEKITGGGTPKTSISEYWQDGEITWISPTDFGKQKGTKYISTSEKKITDLGVLKSSATLLPEGTVIMSSRASIGEPKIAGKEVTTNQGFISYITNHKLHNNYLFYCIECQLGDYFLNIASGTTFMEISRRLASIEYIPLPPLQEQKAIADYLDKATAKIDRIIAIKEEQLVKMEASLGKKINEIIKRGVKEFELKKSRKDFIGEIPKHYKVQKLKHITTKITDGAHFTPTYLDAIEKNSIPFLRVTDVQVDIIDLNRTKFISKEEHNELIKRCHPEKGDLLLSKNGTIGITKVVDWDWEFSIFVSLCLIKPDRQLNVDYLNYFFKSEIMDFQIKNGSKQITVTNLHLDKIRDFYIVTPPINEQIQIVERLKDIELKFNHSLSNITSQIKTLQAYRKSLIHECVTGKKQIV